MKAHNIIATISIVIAIIGYNVMRLYKHSFFGETTKKGINVFYILLMLLTLFTLGAIVLSYKTIRNTSFIVPSQGTKGKIGQRGSSGNRATPLDSCDDDLCYQKIMNHITNVVNVWNVLHYKPMLPTGKHIKNNYIKGKVKEICDSKEYKLMLKKYGAHKLTISDNPLNTTKCNIHTNCGAYDYILQKWTEWILIILKYKQGAFFLDSPYSTEKEFNNMIEDEDYQQNELTKTWIFNMEQPLIDIILPKQGKEKLIENQNKLRGSAFGKFYTSPGVPSAFLIKDKTLTTEEKFFKILSPFEEIKKYDAWYWGSPLDVSPQIINHCEIKDDNPNHSEKYNGKIKVKLTNTYTTMWDSANAGQIKYSFENKSSKYSHLYEDNILFGNKRIQFLRPNRFYDSQEDDLFFKQYKPIGDVIYDYDETTNVRLEKTNTNDVYPIQNRFQNIESSLSFKKTGPKIITLLVSGDTKSPIDFELKFKSLRTEGFNKNEKGIAIWKPIAPEGYVALGYVINVSTSGLKPDANSIACVPASAIGSSTTLTDIWESKNNKIVNLLEGTAVIEKQNTDIDESKPPIICSSNKNYEFIDKNNKQSIQITMENATIRNFVTTDLEFREDKPQYKNVIVPYLQNYNTFCIKSDNFPIYSIKFESLFYKEKETIKGDIITEPQKKNPREYSILSIYDAKI